MLTAGDTKNASFTAQVQRSSLHDGVNMYDFHLVYDYIGAYVSRHKLGLVARKLVLIQ